MNKFSRLTSYFIVSVLLSLSVNNVLFAKKIDAEKKPEISITITDSSSGQIINIQDSKTINRLYYFWSQKEITKLHHNYNWQYKIMFINKNETNQWVYDPRGYARKITFDNSGAVYQLKPIRAFNHFLTSRYNNG